MEQKTLWSLIILGIIVLALFVGMGAVATVTKQGKIKTGLGTLISIILGVSGGMLGVIVAIYGINEMKKYSES